MNYDAIILGAGISGLTAAWTLKKKNPDIKIKIIEKSDRTGGWIQTVDNKGFMFDVGPRSCRPKGAGIHTLKLIEELNLQNEVIAGDTSANDRFIWHKKKLHKLPKSILSLFTCPLTRSLPNELLREAWRPSSTLSDETIYDFISRRFSKATADTFADAMVSGIYAGDIHQLSIKSCFPILFEWEKKHGSIVKGMIKDRKPKETSSAFIEEMQKHSLFSFRNGMETLTNALQNRLTDNLTLSTEATSLQVVDDRFFIELSDGKTIETKHLFCTLPAYVTATLLKKHHPELSEQLNKIATTSLAVVSLGYNDTVLTRKGFGHLIPTSENEQVLGIVYDSSIFPEQNRGQQQTRLSVMMGGAHHQDLMHLDDASIVAIARDAVYKQLNISESPQVALVSRALSAIPQYTLGHAERVAKIEESVKKLSPNFKLLGSSYHGVAINDCIAKALT